MFILLKICMWVSKTTTKQSVYCTFCIGNFLFRFTRNSLPRFSHRTENYQCSVKILFYNFKRENEANYSFQAKSCPAFSLIPSGQCSSSHCCFGKGNVDGTQGYVLPLPLYSPDLAPSDKHLFSSFKFFRRESLMRRLLTLSKNGPTSRHKISTLLELIPECWNKCIALAEDYIEKYVKSINNCNKTNFIVSNKFLFILDSPM